jgi:hypothetical protein
MGEDHEAWACAAVAGLLKFLMLVFFFFHLQIPLFILRL